MKLSDTACRTAKPQAKTYKMADCDDMYLEVRPNGAKYWRMRYRFNDKQKTLVIGVYPETTLKRAREKRDEARRLLSANIDPSQQKQQKKRQAKISADNTFEAIAHEWHTTQQDGWTANHARDVWHRLSKDVFPEIGHRPIADIKPAEMLDVVRKIEKRGAKEMARRSLQMSSNVFQYAIITNRSESNPASDLKGPLKPRQKEHFAALDINDLPEFMHILRRNEARPYEQTRNAIELLILTFVRTGELIIPTAINHHS